MHRGVGLNMKGHDFCMMAEIELEGITRPPPFYADRVEGNTLKQILESPTNAETMTLEGRPAGACSSSPYAPEKCDMGECPTAVLDSVHK